MTKKKENKRPKRMPTRRTRLLEAKPRPGFVRRFVNEEPGVIEAFEETGWRVVSGDEDASEKRAQTASQLDSVVRVVVNRDREARAHTAVLMEIPQEIFDEIQAYKQEQLDEQEASWNPKLQQKMDPTVYGDMKRRYS